MINMYSIVMTSVIDDNGPLTGHDVWRLSLRLRTAMDRTLAPLGLTNIQYSLLGSLLRLGQTGRPPSQRELADFSELEPMYVSKIIRSLERARLVRRTPNSRDARAFVLALTDDGVERFRQARPLVRAVHDAFMAPLGAPDDPARRAFVEGLRILLAAERDGSGADSTEE